MAQLTRLWLRWASAGLMACGSAPLDKTVDTGGGAMPAEAVAPEDRLVVVGESVSLDAAESTGSRFSWDFDDGSSAEGAVVEHTWTAPGAYRVRLTAHGAPSDRDDLVVTVVYPPLEQAPHLSLRRSCRLAGAHIHIWITARIAGLWAAIDRGLQPPG